jgi:glucose-6-phosphate 1-epimerase
MVFPTQHGAENLPKVHLAAPDGAQAEIYLHGAQVTSWWPAGDADGRLFLSARSAFRAGAAIRGGIPVSFPQFAGQGPLANHGFARVMPWDLAWTGVHADGSAGARFCIEDNDATRLLWPHAFALELVIRLSGRSLDVALAVTNTGRDDFTFTAALHTYLRIRDIAATTVLGLQGAEYFDKVIGKHDCRETAAGLRIAGPVDRIYRAAPQDLQVQERDRSMAICTTGFPDTVVWNPGPKAAASLADLEPGGEQRMLCVEAAAAAAPVALAAGAAWRGSQSLTAR